MQKLQNISQKSVIIHLVAISNHSDFKKINESMDINLNGTLNMLKVAQKNAVNLFLHHLNGYMKYEKKNYERNR